MTLDTHVDQISIFENFGIQFYFTPTLICWNTMLLKQSSNNLVVLSPRLSIKEKMSVSNLYKNYFLIPALSTLNGKTLIRHY